MVCTLPRRLAAAALALMLLVPLTGCAGRPQRRPTVSVSNNSVAQTISRVEGTGAVAAVVDGDLALAAIQLDQLKPGGADGWPLSGIGGPMGRPGGGPNSQPVQDANPAGGAPALPGGSISPGGSAPGGTPTFTQAVPNGKGGLATSDGVNVPTPAPNSYHSAPIDILNRAADRVITEHPTIREVRFLTTPSDAVRLQEIANDLEKGQPLSKYRTELNALTQKSFTAGTATIPMGYPPQGTKPITPRR